MKRFFYFIIVMLTILLFCNTKAETLEKTYISIDIKGAINNPGYYKLESNSTVYDAINASGGLMNYADTSIINLSKKLKDEDVIIIYTIDEVQEMKSGDTSIKIIEKECVCPKINNVACINTSSNSNKNLVNINTASLDELQKLSGIGKGKAEAIINYRKTKKFTKIDDIMNVKGIGKSIFDKIKENITI